MTKMTYAVAIDRAIAGDVDAEVVERLENLKAQLAKRGSGKKGLTKTQKEGLCQRASALLKKLVEDKRVRKDKVGKQVRFFLA